MTAVSCPSCGQRLSLPDEYLGRQVRCAVCQTAFPVGSPDAAPLAVPAVATSNPPPAPASPFAFVDIQEPRSSERSFRSHETDRVATLMQIAVAMDVLIATLFFINLMSLSNQFSELLLFSLSVGGSITCFLLLVFLFVTAKMLGQQRCAPMVIVASILLLLIACGLFWLAATLGTALWNVPAIHWSLRTYWYPMLALLCYAIGCPLNAAAGFRSLMVATKPRKRDG